VAARSWPVSFGSRMLVYVLMFLLDTTPPVKRRAERPAPRRSVRRCVMGPPREQPRR